MFSVFSKYRDFNEERQHFMHKVRVSMMSGASPKKKRFYEWFFNINIYFNFHFFIISGKIWQMHICRFKQLLFFKGRCSSACSKSQHKPLRSADEEQMKPKKERERGNLCLHCRTSDLWNILVNVLYHERLWQNWHIFLTVTAIVICVWIWSLRTSCTCGGKERDVSWKDHGL